MNRLKIKLFLAGILVILGLFFASWVVTKATADEGPPGMDVPAKGTTSEYLCLIHI